MSRIILSVILPLYQAEEQIPEVFAALASQTKIRKNRIEILLWNDGSHDDTQKAIETNLAALSEYAGTRVYNHATNQGLFATRLAAAEQAQGQFITFIDKQTRPVPDYLHQMLAQKWPLVVGSPYMDKRRSIWDRVLYLIRRKLYVPYFGSDFPDLTLTTEQYRRFRNKGGGNSLLVRRDWFIAASRSLRLGKHSSDDSLLITKLTEFSPLRKTAKAKILYVNRTGFQENLQHLFWRGPKFIDYYLWPWNRYSPIIFIGLLFLAVQPLLLLLAPALFALEGVSFALLLAGLSLWLAEEPADVLPTLVILPLATISFSLGCLLGVGIKILPLAQATIRK